MILFLSGCCLVANAQKKLPPFINPQSYNWADSVLDRMTLEEKIGQLFMVQMQSVWPQRDLDSLASLIRNYHIGGIIVFKGGPYRQAECINRMQSEASVPLLVGIDGEWGLSMRMDSTIRFPRQMTLTAMGNDSMIYETAAEIGRQCKRMGIQLNFAPDIDINNNPLNPVINTRSFSDDKIVVSRHGMQYMKGLQDNKVIACAKHFPGHGDTDTDSHYSLPVINKSEKELDTLEWYPFKQLINGGVDCIMTGHLNVPLLDDENNPASLSSKIIRTYLEKDLDFKGIIVSDTHEYERCND
ncbi:MAG: glycoside hydrolase family 3 N-terminal domain-containing protein [Bacteroidia bacterium]